MKIVKIEPTPSPNTMKITLDEHLSAGNSTNYKPDHAAGAPLVIQEILKIEGIKGVYHVADFLAVERNGRVDWQSILPLVRQAFGESGEAAEGGQGLDDSFGEVQTFIQTFKGIPLQLKLMSADEEKRFALPSYFMEAFNKIQETSGNFVLERAWKEFGVRYGELEQIGAEVVEELTAAYPPERVDALVKASQTEGGEAMPMKPVSLKLTATEWEQEEDWRKRYQALEKMAAPTVEDLPLLEKALVDEKPAIRRLAVVYIGMIEDKQVLPLLIKGLQDSSVTVRRTAGDCLSDLGFEEAIPAMCEALKDKSKIVRWRAAMYLYEVGDESALAALKEAENDPEFEVQMQIKMAIERIEGGEQAKGSVWKQMTEARQRKEMEDLS